MAASALKMAAIRIVVLVLLASTVGQPAMAYVDGLACPSAATPCRTECVPLCDMVAQTMCSRLCSLTPSFLDGVDQACVNHFFTPCQVVCKNLCEPLPLPGPTNNP